MRTSISGWACWKDSSRGSSQVEAKEGTTESVRMRSSASGRSSRTAPRRLSKPWPSSGRAASAGALGTSPRPSRRSSPTPSSSSSALTWWLTAAGVTCSSSAARVRLRWRAAASKARSAVSEGRRRLSEGMI